LLQFAMGGGDGFGFQEKIEKRRLDFALFDS
jgi:hypothetical protein